MKELIQPFALLLPILFFPLNGFAAQCGGGWPCLEREVEITDCTTARSAEEFVAIMPEVPWWSDSAYSKTLRTLKSDLAAHFPDTGVSIVKGTAKRQRVVSCDDRKKQIII